MCFYEYFKGTETLQQYIKGDIILKGLHDIAVLSLHVYFEILLDI